MFLKIRAPPSTWILTLVNLLLGMGLWIFGDGNNGTSHWEPDPSSGRGTWSILSSCIITLSLCVYTALHLNIPAHRSSSTAKFGLKAKYVLSGLLAPEVIVYNAWRQRTAAASLVSRVRKARGGRPPKSLLKHIGSRIRAWYRVSIAKINGKPWRHIEQLLREEEEIRLPWDVARDPWANITLFHGFYITMGGYAFDVVAEDQTQIWPDGIERLTISPKAVAACLASDYHDLKFLIPYLSQEAIWDKSKANGLAKAIVCIQAFWFMIQVIGRLSQQFPISLLELNTFAHALCALLVYLLWWDKPLDIEEATVIKTSESEVARNVCIMSWNGVQGPVEYCRAEYDVSGGFWMKLLIRVWRAIGASSSGPLSDSVLICNTPTQSSGYKSDKHVVIAGTRYSVPVSKTPEFSGLTTEESNLCDWISSSPPIFRIKRGEAIPGTSMFVSAEWDYIEVDELLFARIRLAEQLRASPYWTAYDKALRPVLNIDDKDLTMLKPRELNFSDSLMRNSFEDDAPVSRNLIATIGIILSGFIYGALHMLAWGSNTFHSSAEQVLWIVACCAVALGGPLVFLGIWVLDKVSNLNVTVYGIKLQTLLLCISAPFGIIIGLVYAASRVYLVVEVFRNLAFLDPKIYATPDWPVYFPHIT